MYIFNNNSLQGRKFTCLVEECGKHTLECMDNLSTRLLVVHGIDERNRQHTFCCPLYEEKIYHDTLLTYHMSEAVSKSTGCF